LSRDLDLTFELDTDSAKVNQQAKFLGQNYLWSKVTYFETYITRTHRNGHTRAIVVSGPLQWSPNRPTQKLTPAQTNVLTLKQPKSTFI